MLVFLHYANCINYKVLSESIIANECVFFIPRENKIETREIRSNHILLYNIFDWLK